MTNRELLKIIRDIEFDERISDSTYNCYIDLVDMIKSDIQESEVIKAEARVDEARAELQRMNSDYMGSV